MRCPSCRAYNRAGAAFCVDCGAALAPRPRRRLAHGWLVRPLLLLARGWLAGPLFLLVILLLGGAALAFSPLGQRLGALGQFLGRLEGERTIATRETVVLGIQNMSQLAT